MAKAIGLEMGETVHMPAGQDAQARRFYGNLLGMRETMRAPGEKGVWFQFPEGTYKIKASEAPENDSAKVVARFRVDNAETIRQGLSGARFRIYDAPPETGTRGFYVLDPFGNRIELRQRR